MNVLRWLIPIGGLAFACFPLVLEWLAPPGEGGISIAVLWTMPAGVGVAVLWLLIDAGYRWWVK